MAAANEESAVVMGQVPQSVEEGILRLESKLQRPLTPDELVRVSTMYQRIDGARASIFKGVCKGRVTPESAGGFESAIAGCRAKAWTIVRQKILDAEARRLRAGTDGVEHGVRQARELLRAMGRLKKAVGEPLDVEVDVGSDAECDVDASPSSDFEGQGVASRGYEDADRDVYADLVRSSESPVVEVRARPAKRLRLM